MPKNTQFSLLLFQRLRNSRTFGSRSFQYNNREIRLLPTCQMIMNNENIMGNLKFFGRPVYFEESDEKTALKFALLQKGCARFGMIAETRLKHKLQRAHS